MVVNIEYMAKVSAKARIMEHKRRVQESPQILTTYTAYHSKSIRRIPDFDELKDHCLTLKNTPYPHQRYAVYNTLVNEEEQACFTQYAVSIRKIRRIHALTSRALAAMSVVFSDNITISESERYPPDEYLHPYAPSQRYKVNSNVVSFIDPYERPEPIVIKTNVSFDQHDQADQNDHLDQNDEILKDYQSKHSNHNNDNHIFDNLPNTKDVQTSEPLSSPAKDALVSNIILIPTNPSLSIPSMASLAPQDRWSQDKHIELVNIIGNPGAGMLTRAMAKELSAALAHECLFIKQSERVISINQEKYVKDLLKKYDINGSSVKTPMVPPNNLGPDLNGKAVNETQYIGMIGSLMYLTASRHDIQFSSCLCARYQTNHKESHLIAVKRIFRYLK
ncbi:hypothetical protein Tco_0815949, partial [Tanacetum coccineum]